MTRGGRFTISGRLIVLTFRRSFYPGQSPTRMHGTFGTLPSGEPAWKVSLNCRAGMWSAVFNNGINSKCSSPADPVSFFHLFITYRAPSLSPHSQMTPPSTKTCGVPWWATASTSN